MVTNLQASPFFVNPGDGKRFRESSSALQTWYPSLLTNRGYSVTPVSWGINFFDADNDMDVDLYITNGALNPGLPPNPNLFFENIGGYFQEIGKTNNTDDHSIGRGSVTFDYDNDGDMDLLVINQSTYQNINTPFRNYGTRLFRNDTKENNWLKIDLEGIVSETNGIGSRVEVHVDDIVLIREIDGGSSHESQNSTIAHFGLGNNSSIDSVVIKWSAGHYQSLKNVDINQQLTITESLGKTFDDEKEISIHIAPNPITSSAFIQFELEENIDWSLDVYNLMGKKVAHLKNGNDLTGIHTLEDVRNYASGVYLMVVTTDEFIVSEKFVIR
jgi:hypothetical protein